MTMSNIKYVLSNILVACPIIQLYPLWETQGRDDIWDYFNLTIRFVLLRDTDEVAMRKCVRNNEWNDTS